MNKMTLIKQIKTWEKLLSWSSTQYQNLPWRINRTPYSTLVSEIMLQQTTVATVINFYEPFLQRFPTLQDLVAATDKELLQAWKGLGYYRRVINLRGVAQTLQNEFAGAFPQEISTLQSIKGIGPYTAHAVRALAFDLPALAVDANCERVFARVYRLEEIKGLSLQKKIREDFEAGSFPFLEKFSPRAVNEAVMDLGRVVCRAKKAQCELCPLQEICLSAGQVDRLDFPTQIQSSNNASSLQGTAVNETKKSSKGFDVTVIRVIIQKGEKVLAYQKSSQEWLSGQFEIPTLLVRSEDKTLKQYPVLKKLSVLKKQCGEFKTGITKYNLKNIVLSMTEQEFRQLKFPHPVEWHSLGDHNLSTSSLKALKSVEKKWLGEKSQRF
jgi:A/G-specific adenine glycosylase